MSADSGASAVRVLFTASPKSGHFSTCLIISMLMMCSSTVPKYLMLYFYFSSFNDNWQKVKLNKIKNVFIVHEKLLRSNRIWCIGLHCQKPFFKQRDFLSVKICSNRASSIEASNQLDQSSIVSDPVSRFLHFTVSDAHKRLQCERSISLPMVSRTHFKTIGGKTLYSSGPAIVKIYLSSIFLNSVDIF